VTGCDDDGLNALGIEWVFLSAATQLMKMNSGTGFFNAGLKWFETIGGI
jgi:hypothetical protein